MTIRHIGYWHDGRWQPWCEVFPSVNFPRIAVDPPFDGSCQDCLALAIEAGPQRVNARPLANTCSGGIDMTNSERIAQALAECFKCSECKEWKPLADIGRDIPWDAERVAGYLCWLCERDLRLLAEQWPGREVA